MNIPDVSVTLISHASVIISIGESRILTDPWQFGTAFNDSWKLIAPPADLAPVLDSIDFLWISHEHPDHFHIPTLKSLPQSFKARVTVLFQRSNDSDKMVKAFKEILGFANVILLDHRVWRSIKPGVDVYCYQSRQIDSALAIRGGGKIVLNMNDCESSDRDLAIMHNDMGSVDILLNQFSIAGFDGNESQLAFDADKILTTMIRDHRALCAKITIPFASFIYFCCTDNAKLNPFINVPSKVAYRYLAEKLNLVVLMPGETFRVGDLHDNAAALKRFDILYNDLSELPLNETPSVPIEEIQTAFAQMRKKLVFMHGRIAMLFLRPVLVAVPDLDMCLRLSFRQGTLTSTNVGGDIEINSQPLYFMLANNFGLQTLGVSGRYRLHNGLNNWFKHRALFSMLNAGFGLSVRQFFRYKQLSFLWRRRGSIGNQLKYRVGRTLAKVKP